MRLEAHISIRMYNYQLSKGNAAVDPSEDSINDKTNKDNLANQRCLQEKLSAVFRNIYVGAQQFCHEKYGC